MTDQIRNAHIRAASSSPAYRVFEVFRQVADDTNGRPLAGKVNLVDTCKGRINWQDLDKFDRTLGGETGEAQVSLLTNWPFTPAALRDETGKWYVVKSALGMDTLGVFTRLLVRNWNGDLPTILPIL